MINRLKNLWNISELKTEQTDTDEVKLVREEDKKPIGMARIIDSENILDKFDLND